MWDFFTEKTRKKLTRAIRLSAVGAFSETASELSDCIPETVIDGLTVQRLSQLMDALWYVSSDAQARANQNAIDAGRVCDARCGLWHKVLMSAEIPPTGSPQK